eukprot:GHVT01096491.1.p1 GENE.GHVT01096491.1~~GHVT01096491.1.p1  ORF type:complete len:256 (+),score=25.34 GHVT01096491.1:217-984(+)
MEVISRHRCFHGVVFRCRHEAKSLGKLSATFSVFLPEAAGPVMVTDPAGRYNVANPPPGSKKVPLICYLSGLTCTDENFVIKSGAFRKANELKLAILVPDTSPRGSSLPTSPSWKYGSSAGWYLDAKADPWAAKFKMSSYILSELIPLVRTLFPIADVPFGLMGHSMGGHGALTLGLKHPEMVSSVSALAPICNPSVTPWGEEAFSALLGSDRSEWSQHDAVELLKTYRGKDLHLLVDVGDNDGMHHDVAPLYRF